MRGFQVCFVRVMFFSVIALLCACQGAGREDNLSIVMPYIEIPEFAKNVNVFRFSEGQWRVIYIKFTLNDNELNDFTSTTCFGEVKKLYNKYPSFHISDFTIPELPIWWTPNPERISFEGSCDQNGINLGMAIEGESTGNIIYMIIFIP